MTDEDLDTRLAAMLRRPDPVADPAFVDRVLTATALEARLAVASRRRIGRALAECLMAVAVGGSFYALSRIGPVPADGMIAPGAPAMAGLLFLLLWAVTTLPAVADSTTPRRQARQMSA